MNGTSSVKRYALVFVAPLIAISIAILILAALFVAGGSVGQGNVVAAPLERSCESLRYQTIYNPGCCERFLHYAQDGTFCDDYIKSPRRDGAM